jgi:hypothetical protein
MTSSSTLQPPEKRMRPNNPPNNMNSSSEFHQPNRPAANFNQQVNNQNNNTLNQTKNFM